MKTRKEIMTRAHEIARTLEGNYSARMSFSLKKAWAETRETLTEQFENFIGFKFEVNEDARISELYLTKKVTVKYADFKNNLDCFGYAVKKGTYDATTKTIELTIKMSTFWDNGTVEEYISSKNLSNVRLESRFVKNYFRLYAPIKEALSKCTIIK